MAEGGWVVLGAAIGTIGSVATTLLNAWLTKNKPDYFDQRAMSVLKAILTDSKDPWHSIQRLSRVVGLKDEHTRQLLLLIGARGHESGSGGWALISRVGTKIEQTDNVQVSEG
ncbi:hypothetical protein [Bradyrhizobium sp. 27S5]|uniref:hypothetical protein n=1 Tax=Bradyrhizobium sp. 27S5 TaxID=3139728 RepID=UPI0030D5123F